LIVLKTSGLDLFLQEMRSEFFLSWLYFEACTPLPPSEDRIKWKAVRHATIEAKA